MRFLEQKIAGLYLVEPHRHEDDRGFFARTFCEREFQQLGLEYHYPQANLSHNLKRGTLRGLHLQKKPGQEAKIVRCIRGSIFDVALDLRPESATFGQWQGFELSEQNGLALYIPKGLAHGFQTLVEMSDVYYHMSEPFVAGLQAGVNPLDPEIGIAWPLTQTGLSPKDLSWPTMREFVKG
jgi:dTDP-4-dehydrorhamnose 3,5-epimerase